MEEKITIGNVCFIFDKANNKILLLKRNREPMSNMYTGVGGKTKFDEDVYTSCLREIKEETGLDVPNLKLKAIVKTILEEFNSAWLLFVYTADEFNGDLIDCEEGELHWVDVDTVLDYDLIGFIQEIFPAVLDENKFIEARIKHDIKGQVLESHIKE